LAHGTGMLLKASKNTASHAPRPRHDLGIIVAPGRVSTSEEGAELVRDQPGLGALLLLLLELVRRVKENLHVRTGGRRQDESWARIASHDNQPHKQAGAQRTVAADQANTKPSLQSGGRLQLGTGGKKSWPKITTHDGQPRERVNEGLLPQTRPRSLSSTVVADDLDD